MAIYRITDPQTGRTFKLTGDSPPTETEIMSTFESIMPGSMFPEPEIGPTPTAALSSMSATTPPTGTTEPELAQFAPYIQTMGSKRPNEGVMGLVNSPEFKSLQPEQRQRLMSIINTLAGQSRIADITQGTGNIGLTALALGTTGAGGGPAAAVRTPLTRGVIIPRVSGLPKGYEARLTEGMKAWGLSQVPKAIKDVEPVLAPLFQAMTAGVETGAKIIGGIIKGSVVSPIKIVAGARSKLFKTAAKTIGLDKSAPKLYSALMNPTTQNVLLGLWIGRNLILGKKIFTGRAKLKPQVGSDVTGRGTYKEETEINP